LKASELVFEQIPVGSHKNFSYLLGENVSKKAVIFDPAWEVELLMSKLAQNRFKLDYIINTHAHFDHIEGNLELKDLTGAKVIMHQSSLAPKDRGVSDGEEIVLGDQEILKFFHTPGHSPESMCVQIADFGLVTGDTLFIGECGRVDLPGGDANLLYDSFEKIRRLDPNLTVYPGHDYGKKKSTSLSEQLETNYTLAKRSREDFLKFMSEP
jgi:hydroxyacylglutathione hydrolase